MTKTCFVVLVILITVLSWQNVVLAESKDIDKIKADILSFGEQVIFDAEYIFNSPRRMKTKDYITWATIFAAAGIMYSEKEDIRDWIQDNKTSFTDDISAAAEPLGRRVVPPAIAAGFYLEGLLLDDPKSKETGFMIIESFCYTGILIKAGQYVFAEERPGDGGQMHFFKSRGHGISGHAAFASCMAGPLNRQYLQITDADSDCTRFMKYSGKAIVYGYPILTGLSRLNDDKHYSWNVLLGLATGFTIGELVANAHTESKKNDISLMPIIDDEYKGVMVSARF